MVRRTTIELDEELVERAKRALRCSTTRATVEEALRRAANAAEAENRRRAERQVRFLAEELPKLIDIDVYASDEMWR